MKIIEGEIEVNIIENIIKNIPSIKEIYREDFTILIHGMGCKTRSYYEMIPHTKNVNLLWTGWSSRKWWTYLLRFIPGEAGLVEIKDRKKSAELFLEIGEQSMCGLYFIPKVKLIEIVEDVKITRGKNIEEILKEEKEFFLLIIDFDYMDTKYYGDIYYRRIILGTNLNQEIRMLLK